MSQVNRTLGFLGFGTALAVIGIALLPRTADFDTAMPNKDKPLFENLKDGTVARGMEIIDKDLQKFEVKQVNNRWVLPSHKNYPADAKQQLVDASSALVGLKPVSVEDAEADKHALYGVLEPNDENRKKNAKGLGKLVSFTDGDGKNLAKLIIGKALTSIGRETKETDLRFVRIVGQDPVYVVKLPTDKFSPKFEDWIETDLLKLNAFDIRKVDILDYTFRVVADLQGLYPDFSLKGDLKLSFDDKDSKWTLDKLSLFDEKAEKPVEQKLEPGEELNTAKLNELKTALDDLKIINVVRKPQSLITSFQEGELKLDRESAVSLQKMGYFMVRGADNKPELLSKDGEVVVKLRDGIVYKLRFGDFAESAVEAATEQPKEDGKSAPGKEPAAPAAPQVNRYIMVSATFDKSLIPAPELTPLPEAKKAEEESAPTDKPANKSAESKTDEKPADEKPKAEPTKSEPGKTPDGKQSSRRDNSLIHTVAFQAGEKTEAAKEPSAAKVESTVTDAAKSEPIKNEPAKGEAPPAEAPKNNAPQSDAAKQDAPPMTTEKEPDPLEFERKRIQLENETKQKDYEAKIKEGERKAKQLNERFAQWYYVISDDVYKKIHLGKSDVIQAAKLPGSPDGPANPLKIPGNINQPGFPPPGLPGLPGGE